MLAPIRLTNAGSCPSRQRDCVATAARSAETKGTAQLVLRTQVRRKETHPHHPSAPLPPLRGSSITCHKSVSKAQPAGFLATTRLVHLVLSGTSISRKRHGSVMSTVMFPSFCSGKSYAGDHWHLSVLPTLVLARLGNATASLALRAQPRRKALPS